MNMTDIDVRSVSSANEAAREGGALLSSLLARYSEDAVLLLLSGGSALSMLSYVSGDAVSEYLAVGMLDDRNTTDPQTSNFLQMSATPFYSVIREKNALVYSSVPRERESLSDLAGRLDDTYRSWKMEHPDGKIIITQGIGPDGHTAGIMPYPDEPLTFEELFVRTEQWMTGYDAGNRSPLRERVTATMPFFRQVDESVVYACGEVKRDALRRSLSTSGVLAETPAWVISGMKHVTLFTDLAL